MRCSNYFLATEKENPIDAKVASHQLMVRAGMIRKLASGLYTWLPTGLKVLQKVEKIVREEMNTCSLEVLMPMVQPAELWQETGRYNNYGDNLAKFKDRKQADFVLGPTHEEIITDMVRNNVNSYRQLPLCFYQIQTKFRDETRPRFGILRTREFIMKDAYSFHMNEDCLKKTYHVLHDTYCNIFDRLGLDYRAVYADNGDMGGEGSQEFQIITDTGEDLIAYSDTSNYAANLEKAPVVNAHTRQTPTLEVVEEYTPGVHSIDDLLNYKKDMQVENSIKILIVEGSTKEKPYIALALRGDHTLNEVKAIKHPLIQEPLQFTTPETIFEIFKANVGSLGVINCPIHLIADSTAALCSDFSTGANKDDYHFFNVNWDRDVKYDEVYDLRNAVDGDLSPDGQGKLKITRGIEVGHIFQLGLFYSKALKAYVSNSTGTNEPLWMGCYGIGVTRIVAAAIEQSHDEKGIIWNKQLTPWDIALIAINYNKSEKVKAFCDELYEACKAQGIDVLFDDRSERPGVAFAEMDLIGIPHVFVVGEKNLAANIVEYKERKTGTKESLSLDNLVAQIKAKIAK